MFPKSMTDEEFLVLDDDEDKIPQSKTKSSLQSTDAPQKINSTISSIRTSISNALESAKNKIYSISKKKEASIEQKKELIMEDCCNDGK